MLGLSIVTFPFKEAYLDGLERLRSDESAYIMLTTDRYDDPPEAYVKTVGAVLSTRRFVLRYLSLPKPAFMAKKLFSDEADPKTGRYFYLTYKDYPYYNKPTFWNRWGPEALFWRLLGGTVPGDKKWYPQGYLFEELGPKKVENQGKDKTDQWEERLRVQRTPGCPFTRR